MHRGGCPFCAGLKLSVTNSLAARFPAIAAELHLSKNGKLTAKKILAGAHRRVWRRCARDKKHAWKQGVNVRTWAGSGCPFCAMAKRIRGLAKARALTQRRTISLILARRSL